MAKHKKSKNWEEHFRVWLEKEGYTENINHYGINELIRHIEVNYIIPLKAELMKRETVMQNLRNALDNYLEPI